MAGALRDFVGYGKNPPHVVWPDRARLALSLVVNFEEGAERTPLYGDSVVVTGEGNVLNEARRDVQGESIFDYGSRIAFWRLLDLFDAYGVKATYFACGLALENNP